MKRGDRICNVEGCGKKHYGRGYCTAHHTYYKRRGIIKPLKEIHDCTDKLCEVCNSSKQVYFNEKTQQFLCRKHREQVYAKGKTERTQFDGNDFNINEINNTLEIIMYNGKEIHKCYCDLNMADKVMKYIWYYDYSKGYATSRIKGKLITMSKFITGWGCIPDHINRNKLDDRLSNLRPANRSTNAMNSKISTKNTSGVKGVCWHERSQKWRAYIKYKNKSIHIGLFKNKEDAIESREKAELQYFDEFSPNFEILKEKYKDYYNQLHSENYKTQEVI